MPGLFFLLVFFTGCKKEASVESETDLNPSTDSPISSTEKKENIQKAIWYEFSTDETTSSVALKEIQNPKPGDSSPWTEAVSVTGVGLMYNPAIFLVNKVGILSFSDLSLNEPQLHSFDLLSDRTVDGFYSSNDGTLLRIYLNSVFSAEPILNTERRAFLCRYNPISEEVMPLYFPENFGLPKYAQCTHLEKIADIWYTSFKIETGNQVNFSFFKFKSIDKIASANYSEITKEEFQDALKPVTVIAGKAYSDPVLNAIAMSFEKFLESSEIKEVSLTVSSAKELDCKKKFIVKNPNYKDDFKEINANALLNIADYNLVTLTASGAMLFFKANTENLTTKNLPKLPDGFAYSYFFISSNKVVAAWNEESFFEIGKSGILSFKLD